MNIKEITEGYWKNTAIDSGFDKEHPGQMDLDWDTPAPRLRLPDPARAPKPKPKTMTKYAVHFNHKAEPWKVFDTHAIAVDRANKARIRNPKLRADVKTIEVEM